MSGPPGSTWIQRKDVNRNNRRYWQNSVTQEKTYDRPEVLEIPYPSAAPSYPSAAPVYPYPAAQAAGGFQYAPAPAPGQQRFAGGFAAQPASPNNPYVSTSAFNAPPAYPLRGASHGAASAPPAPNPALRAAEHALIVAQTGVQDASMIVDMLRKELTAHETVVENRKRQLATAIADHEKIEAKLAASIALLTSSEAAVVAAFAAIEKAENEQKSKEKAEIEAAIAQVEKLEAQEKAEREAREAADAVARVTIAEASQAAADEQERALQAEMHRAMEQALEAEMQAAMAASLAALPVAVQVPAAAPAVAMPVPVSTGPLTPPGSRWIQRKHESNNRKYWQNNVTGEKTYVNPL